MRTRPDRSEPVATGLLGNGWQRIRVGEEPHAPTRRYSHPADVVQPFASPAAPASPIALGIRRGVPFPHSLIRPRTAPTSTPPSDAPGALPGPPSQTESRIT